MTDEADAAQRLEERERDAAITRGRARARTGRNCVRCGEGIPADDLAANPDAMECNACVGGARP
ncbi:MAG TPA: molecular chaperone DnaK [Rhodospirillaceae bacterium]|nr:molecular chaperone DnaK [Magnetovibrio sp.]HBT44319.1 hypothetical protein [Rhodospirillaceae bacterium]HCS70076.1 molecular chaperone DnaK [Rhodospirillaceae bacterium]|tara:strand:+ start:321 stop:512 length:192 start_codon:yes stop_codon:yes gene_type:complete